MNLNKNCVPIKIIAKSLGITEDVVENWIRKYGKWFWVLIVISGHFRLTSKMSFWLERGVSLLKMSLFGNNNSTMKNGFIVKDSMKINESTEGSEDKFFIKVNNERYLVKDSSFNKRRKQSSLAPFCEYVGSHFIKLVNIFQMN